MRSEAAAFPQCYLHRMEKIHGAHHNIVLFIIQTVQHFRKDYQANFWSQVNSAETIVNKTMQNNYHVQTNGKITIYRQITILMAIMMMLLNQQDM